jgi:Winged helix DNA-binding domain
MSSELLTRRELNRALLARQGLLGREPGIALELVERLVGMQAQVPSNPYLALWARLEGFRSDELDGLIAGRRAVRAQLMRSTIHLVSARDALALHPLTAPVLARAFTSPFAGRLRGADVQAVAAAGGELLAERPRTRAELAALLAERWPDADPTALAHAVTSHSALVQVPPRGLWGRAGQARWCPTESWLSQAVERDGDAEAVVMRYLAAFGPAAAADVRTWSGLTGLRRVLERLRPRLLTFRDERGRELFDVPGAPLPDPATPAPPRFLPEYDNVLLSHADRARILSRPWPGPGFPSGALVGNLLVDGFYRAAWRIEDGTLTIAGLEERPDDPPGVLDGIAAEAERLLAFITPEASARAVRFAA